MRLIHITDPHLSTLEHLSLGQVRGKRLSGFLSWQKNRRHHHLPGVLEQLRLAVLAEKPEQILLTGDLVQIGTEEEVRASRMWLESLGPPERVMFVPGNHDVYGSDSWAYLCRHWSEYLPPDQSSSFSGYPLSRVLNGVELIGLSTACTTPIFSARGQLGQAQADRLSALLPGATQSGRLIFVLIHHPPFKGIAQWRKAVKETAVLETLFARHAPHIVVFGHTHRNHEYRTPNTDSDTRIYSTASASLRHAASYRIFDVNRDASGWRVHMTLKSIAPPGTQSTRPFPVADEAVWIIPPQTVASSPP